MKLFAALLSALMLAGAAAAQDDAALAREKEITAAAASLDALAKELRDVGVEDPSSFEKSVRELIAGSRGRLGPVEEALKRAEDRLALLGPAPKEGEPAEAETVAKERAGILEEITFLRGQRTRVIANVDAATALLDEYSARRLGERYKRILRREPPLVSVTLWVEAGRQAGAVSGAVGRHFSAWIEQRRAAGGVAVSLAVLFGAIVASFMLFGPVSEWLRRAISKRIEEKEPTPGRRVAVAGIKTLARLIPGVLGGLLVIETSRALGLVGAEGVAVVRSIWFALIAYLLVDGFARGLFAPFAPAWRLADVVAAKAKYAFALLIWIVIIVGAKNVLTALVDNKASALSQVIDGAAAMIVGAVLFALCRRNVWVKPTEEAAGGAATDAAPREENAEHLGGPWSAVRFLGRVLATLIMAAPLAGYAPLADFAATRIYYLTLLLTVLWFVRAALKELTAWGDARLRTGRGGDAAKDETQAFQFWVNAGIDLVLLLLLAPMLFILAGVNVDIVRDFILRAFVGIRVGGVTISLVDIFLAIGAFVAILAATRLFQSAMERGPFAHSRIDIGIQNSLTTLFGYVGLVIAAVVGLGMLGVDLTNLALIAGALSVGIGFGLQSIVNNFVSGIILLFERPVRVGDWIVTTSGEGIVKKISVRSTVLETFDRATVIIPNSELVASTVTNWTHKSALGRIRVPVGVSYDSDPELVREILLKCANDHPMVVRYPEPFVVWSDFGASSLDFELRAFLSDISKGLQARTDLRFAIFKAFKEKGIEIPFPQHDIHIRSSGAGPGPAPAKSPEPASKNAPLPHEPNDIDMPDD